MGFINKSDDRNQDDTIKDRKSSILVVDDEKIARKTLERFLKNEGYFVVTAASGEEAIDKLDAYEFDLVMTDLKMDDIDGINIIKKAINKNADIQAILMTGFAYLDITGVDMIKGLFHHLKKPFTIRQVISTVQRALKEK